MTEELRLVTDFDELRPGDFVEVRGCRNCGGSHRRILSGRRVTPESGFLCKPTQVACGGWFDVYHAHPGQVSHVCPAAVADRRVYLIGTGSEASSSEPTASARASRTPRVFSLRAP